MSSREPAVDCLRTSSSATDPCSRSSAAHTDAECSGSGLRKDGSRVSPSIAEMPEPSTGLPGPDEWIASQRASLARIFQRLDEARELAEREAASSARCSEQLTLFDPDACSLKTAQGSERGAATSSSANWWREDIPGETEPLPRLMSAPAIFAPGGGALLPTLTVSGNWNRKGASANSGDGLATTLNNLGPTLLASSGKQSGSYRRGNPTLRGWIRTLPTLVATDMPSRSRGSGSVARGGGQRLPAAIRLLPTLCATDYRSPYSEEGYEQQTRKRSKPLRDTLKHTTGHRLTPAFAEWWMGWPLGWTALAPPATAKSRSKRRQPSFSSAG